MKTLPSRMPQLDGLRGIAAVFVVLAHYPPCYMGEFDYGQFGVRLFFVLSGFLISRILMRPDPSLSTFYIRRAARILPVYYLTLLVVTAIDARVRPWFLWHALYATNFALMKTGDWSMPLGHFWTLAIEQQYYLVWPLVVLTVRKSWLPWIIAAMCVCGPLSRAILCVITDNNTVVMKVATPSCLDAIGLGAMLAWLTVQERSTTWFCRGALIFGLAIMIPDILWKFPSATGPVSPTIGRMLGYSLVSVWAVGEAAFGFKGLAGRFLGHPAVRYLGTISYGLYLFHPFVLHGASVALSVLLRRPVSLKSLPAPAQTALAMTLGCLLAAASWHFFESPINQFVHKSHDRRRQTEADKKSQEPAPVSV